MPAAPPAPRRNNAQHQPLTTVLRNILIEYPSGGGVLRELCQNADDAGATTIEFVLDTRTHKTTDILHPDLAQYQGPALLAYSDSMFTDQDFDSLSRIGDSRKVTDKNTTGKFGRGFNSVYNWTDMPSILSGENLLILDPHCTWSRFFSPESPGGPRWDFVEDIKDGHETMRNQLSAYSSITTDFDNPFPGTIIRLPLRTSLESEIVKGKTTSQDDIIEVFEKFAEEIVESLLFLRNIEIIEMRVDPGTDTSFYARAVVTAEGRDGVKKGFREVFAEQTEEVYEKDFLMDITLETGKGQEKTVKSERFVISHYMKKETEDKQLQEWAREQKLFPWIAIAMPLEVNRQFAGRLFSTLPLPLFTEHPAHIHGLFSVTPDRSNIHAGGDRTMARESRTNLGARWNTWLFQECLPHVWIRNINFLNSMPGTGFTGWNHWPAGIQGDQQSGLLWMGVLSLVFQRIVKRDLNLLPTICGRVGKRKEVLFTLSVEQKIRDALAEAGCQVVVPTEDRKSELARLNTNNLEIVELSVATARDKLSKLKDSLGGLALEHRQVLLDYVLSDRDYESLGFCEAPLLPISDDKFCSFGHSDEKICFPLTPKEAELFKHYPRMIDLEKLSPETNTQLKKDIVPLDQKTCISTWTVAEAASYCKNHIFINPRPPQDDSFITATSPDLRGFIEQFWDWVTVVGSKHCKELSKNPILLDGLWLIPTLGDGIYHRISTKERGISILDVTNPYIGSFLKRTALELYKRDGTQYPIFTGEGLSKVSSLREISRVSSLRELGYIDNSQTVELLISWLVKNLEKFVDRLDDEAKFRILEHLGGEARANAYSDATKKKIRMLSLFREAVPEDTSTSSTTTNRPWISLSDSSTSYFGVEDVPVKLHAHRTIFIDICQRNKQSILSLEIMTCLPVQEIIERFVVPNIVTTGDVTLRAQLITFTLKNFRNLSDQCKSQLGETEIVPVGQDGKILKRPVDIVDISFEEYFFQEECRIPSLEFYNKYETELKQLGMTSKQDEKFVLDRILAYSKNTHTTQEVFEKAQKLMMGHKPSYNLPEEYLTCQWIPASFEGEDGLYNATECRSFKYKDLVKYAMPVMKTQVPEEWERALGWDRQLLEKHVLRQLRGATKAKDSSALRHLIACESKTLLRCKEKFQEDQWVPGNLIGYYYKVCDIFPPDPHLPYGELSPYFGTLSPELNNKAYTSFLGKMGMNKMPTLCQLKDLQGKLAAKGPLGENDLKVALFVVKEVGIRFAEEDLEGFKAPDSKCSLLLLKDLTAGTPGPGDEDRAVLHQDVSPETIRQLKFATFKNRNLDSLVDLEFEDFAQRESPATAISDTLTRYMPATTFNEYLANAEDCGSATKITWILDNSDGYPYSVEKLISPELEKAQGSALFCFNDGEFREKDFKAIIDIGVGSKKKDRSKIGKFGRGALTMYHWTSVPSFISGDSFVIFDPEEQYLPLNSATRKPRAGMKLKLQDVRRKYPDQLLPFEGICGFNKESISFKGTIFRFPIRPSNYESKLKKENLDLGKTREYLMTYYKDAMDSLLFLKKVKEIAFFEKNSKEPVWEVSRKDLATNAVTENIKSFTIHSQCTTDEGLQTTEREWCVIFGKKSEDDLSNSLVKIQMNDRLEARYGLATLMTPQEKAFCGKSYMTLPLRKSAILEVPVHVDANMVVQSNRTSTPLEESEMEEGSEWNKWILEKGVAPLYLILINHLMQNNGNAGYRFWPPYPSDRSDIVSRTISSAFWERLITSPYTLYPPVSSAEHFSPAEHLSSVELKTGGVPMLCFSEVVFDLLEARISSFIVPLLLKLGVNNIVSPPPEIKDYFIKCQSESIKVVSPNFFLGHLRRYSSKLLEIWKESGNDISFFNVLFSFIYLDNVPNLLKDGKPVPPEEKDKISYLMKGSTLLPLADNSLGTFQFKGSADCYLVAQDNQEQALLDFAPKISVHPGLCKLTVIENFMKSNLNIKHFEFSDIPRIYKEVNDRRDNNYRVQWLKKMWAYCETYIRTNPKQAENCLGILSNLEVYFGSRVGQGNDTDTESNADVEFISPAQFSSGHFAVILDQSTEDADPDMRMLLSPLRGLILLDKSAFPQKEIPRELFKEITGTLGFNRLLKSIESLASETQLSIREYITENLKKDGIEALRKFLDPTAMSVLLKEQPQSKTLLEKLPIWPGESGDLSSYRSANDAMLAPDINIPFEGLPENDVFIKASVAKEYMPQLGLFQVKKMNIDELLSQNVREGQSIQTNKIQRYKSFLRTLYQQQPKAFSKHPLAVNGDKKYCKVDSLYCAKDKYFRAAFRDNQKTNFVLPVLQELDFWPNVGLRTNKTENNYLECVRSIQRRQVDSSVPESDQLVTDAETVFEYLTFDERGMVTWAPETWAVLDDSPFPVKLQLGPTYRASRMREVRGSSRFAKFRKAIIQEYESIAWSQCPILNIKPGRIVLERINPRHGAPSAKIVLDHLMFLSDNRFNVQQHQIPPYIQDVKAAYSFLQDNKTSIASKDPKAKIWLNIQAEDEHTITTESFCESWKCSEDLCLNKKHTSGNVQSVLSFLIPFAVLLDSYGVEKVVPPPPPPEPIEFEDPLKRSFDALRRFRQEGSFSDITFKVENHYLKAHKVILCAASEHFVNMFKGDWAESTLDIITLPHEYQERTVSAVFDYIYSGGIPALDINAEAEKTYHHLVYQLELSNLWGLEDLKAKLGDQLCNEHFIRPETVTDIREYAANNNVPRLLMVCDQYIQDNGRLVKRELEEKRE